MAMDVAEVRTVPTYSDSVVTAVSWVNIVAANILAWFGGGDEVTRFVSTTGAIVFTAAGVFLRLGQMIEDRRTARRQREATRDAIESPTLKARIVELEAENKALRDRIDRPA